MASVNVRASTAPVRTHEGGTAVAGTPLQALRRSVLTCLLWEPTFYEKADTIAQRIVDLIPLCRPEDVAALAIEARDVMQIRHVPLLFAYELTRIKGQGALVERTLTKILQRPDELTEYLALYWRNGRRPLSAASKRALRAAFGTFSRYQIAKYRDADKSVKLADVLRMVRPKATSAEQNETYRQLRRGELVAVDTWETELSAGKAKKEVFERLLTEKKLGGLATLRNLRNMQSAGVDPALIHQRLADPMPRVWPYRFIVAAKHAPDFEPQLETAMYRAVEGIGQLRGKTALLIDVSGSMDYALSERTAHASASFLQPELRATPSETSRIDVAAGLAILLREKASAVAIATFSDRVALVPPRRGFALRDAIVQSQPHQSTHLKGALVALQGAWQDADRVIVITDEQSQDGIAPAWTKQSYVINVASYQHGVGDHGGWTKISGWSERVFDYIAAVESVGA